jgi:hypothetical protein
MARLRAEVLRSLQPRAVGSSSIGTGRALAELKADAYERSRAVRVERHLGTGGPGGYRRAGTTEAGEKNNSFWAETLSKLRFFGTS